jgi:hypothetical protein
MCERCRKVHFIATSRGIRPIVSMAGMYRLTATLRVSLSTLGPCYLKTGGFPPLTYAWFGFESICAQQLTNRSGSLACDAGHTPLTCSDFVTRRTFLLIPPRYEITICTNRQESLI